MRTKIKSYNIRVTIFKNVGNENNEIDKEGVVCICLSEIIIDSAINWGKHYFPQALLKECEC